MTYKQTALKKPVQLLLMLSVSITLQFCKTSQTKQVGYEDKGSEFKITYTKHILPMMIIKCTPCYFPDQGRKKMLNTYEATRDNVEDILYRVVLPVSHKDYMPYKSKKEPLTEAEINLIKNWVGQGMPE